MHVTPPPTHTRTYTDCTTCNQTWIMALSVWWPDYCQIWCMRTYFVHLKYTFTWSIVVYLSIKSLHWWLQQGLAPSPGSLIFSMYTWERGGGLISNLTWMLARHHEREAVDFESVWQLQFIKHSSLRPSRIPLHLLEGFGTTSSIHGRSDLPPPFLPLYMGWCPSREIGSLALLLSWVR